VSEENSIKGEEVVVVVIVVEKDDDNNDDAAATTVRPLAESSGRALSVCTMSRRSSLCFIIIIIKVRNNNLSL
jgi:hypothetical protein